MPIYREFFTPRGLGCSTSTLITGPEDTGMSLIFEQTLAKGNISDEAVRILDSLRPHIARSLVLATELDQQKADLLTTGLSAIGAPAAIVQDNGCVLSSNPQFTTALRRVSIRARDRIFLHDESANRLLYDALASIASDQIKSIPLPATEEEQACIVHVIPLCGNALDFSPRGTAIVLIAQPAAAQANDLRILKGLYDLTRSEARIAIEIQSGMALPEIARRLGISYETAAAWPKPSTPRPAAPDKATSFAVCRSWPDIRCHRHRKIPQTGEDRSRNWPIHCRARVVRMDGAKHEKDVGRIDVPGFSRRVLDSAEKRTGQRPVAFRQGGSGG